MFFYNLVFENSITYTSNHIFCVTKSEKRKRKRLIKDIKLYFYLVLVSFSLRTTRLRDFHWIIASFVKEVTRDLTYA